MNRNEYSPHLPPPLITQNPDEAMAEDERGRTSQPIRAPLHRTCRARPNERLPQREEKHAEEQNGISEACRGRCWAREILFASCHWPQRGVAASPCACRPRWRRGRLAAASEGGVSTAQSEQRGECSQLTTFTIPSLPLSAAACNAAHCSRLLTATCRSTRCVTQSNRRCSPRCAPTCSSKGVRRIHSATANMSPASMLSKIVGYWPFLNAWAATSQNTERACQGWAEN